MTEAGAEYSKPLPLMRDMTKEFYDWCRREELRFQRCKQCRAWRHVPREVCAECGSWEWEWARSSGRGRLFTWTVAARPMHPAFMNDVPYAPVVVEMDEGVRIVSTIVDCSPDELVIDMPVEVVFDAVTADIALPRFRRAGRSQA